MAIGPGHPPLACPPSRGRRGIRLAGVQGGYPGGRIPDAGAQFGRVEHLDLGAEREHVEYRDIG
jgi:hypothetical protein